MLESVVSLLWIGSTIIHCVLAAVIIKYLELIREISNGTRVFKEYGNDEIKEKHRHWLSKL